MQSRPSDIPAQASDALPEDDIDQLFQKLQPLTAPEDIVQQVLARVRQLPAALRHPVRQLDESENNASLTDMPDISEASL